MELTLRYTFLEVDDHEAALAFYRDTLGLEVRQDVSMEDAQALKELLAKGSLSGLVLETDDVDALFEKVAASRAEVLQEPMDMPYGVRDCAFRDPAGNMVRLNHAKS